MPRASSRSKAEPEKEEAPARRRRATAAPQPEEPAKKPTRARRGQVVEEAPAPKVRARRTAKETNSEIVVSSKTPSRRTRGSAASPAEILKDAGFNPYADLDARLDAIEKHIGLSESSMDKTEKRLSTGNLCLDIILGGGITAGWYTNFGQEQTCKTTGAVSLLAAALNSNVPILAYWDYEGSASPDYIENILHSMGVKADVKSIFGIRDEKTGQYLVKPRVRYKSEGVAEKFFDYLASLERMLPDKKKIGDNWYFIYDGKTSTGKAHTINAKIVGKNYDQAYFKKTGNYRVPAPDGSLQALILVDSYPAMLPEKQDVDDPNSAIAVQARMFSDQLKRVKGKMRGKRIAVVGINQLRKVPMAMYGPTESEPCGEALKLYSDVRLKYTSRALSAASKYIGEKIVGKGPIETEESVQHRRGDDSYRYIHIRGHKNKLSRPYLDTFLRLWISDPKGKSWGFDPVWDTYVYLRNTGQATGKRSKFYISLEKHEIKKSLDWFTFKRWILGDRATVKDICTSLGIKPFDIRAACFKQMASGHGIELYNEKLAAGKEKAAKGSGSDAGSDSDSSSDGSDGE